MISAIVSHASGFVLFAGGIAWLFAPDAVTSGLGLSLPASALWLVQLLGAAWLALGALNWVQRRAILGGAYGRPLVIANLFHCFIGAMVSLKAAQEETAPWVIAVPFALLALTYGALLFRGPFNK